MSKYGMREQQEEIRAEINVTPLVDVCLVLLVIFMVITPLMNNHGVRVKLPVTTQPVQKSDDQKELVLTINKDANLFIENVSVSRDELKKRLTDLYQRNPAKQIWIRADESLAYKEVKATMQTVQQAGFEDMSLITQRSESGS